MIDAGRNVVLVGAAAQEEGHFARRHVLPRQRRHMPLDSQLGRMAWQPLDRLFLQQALGHVAEQLVDRAGTDDLEHLVPVGLGQRQVAHQRGFLMKKRRRT